MSGCILVIARSTCDEAIQIFRVASGLLRASGALCADLLARNDGLLRGPVVGWRFLGRRFHAFRFGQQAVE